MEGYALLSLEAAIVYLHDHLESIAALAQHSRAYFDLAKEANMNVLQDWWSSLLECGQDANPVHFFYLDRGPDERTSRIAFAKDIVGSLSVEGDDGILISARADNLDGIKFGTFCC